MNSTLKLFKRFFTVLLLSFILLLVFNLILLVSITYRQAAQDGPWTVAKSLSASLSKNDLGEYQLSQEGLDLLKARDAWAILIDDKTGNVIWQSQDLPPEVPLHYPASATADAAQGYIADFPTTWAGMGDDLLFVGHPKKAYWKLIKNTFDYQLIANSPKYLLLFMGCNIGLIFTIYMIVTSGILRSIKPILYGLETLPSEESTWVKEKGLFADLAHSINLASEKLQTQAYELKKKETARANWIAGVSHDVRTPLSMVMGYAGQLEADPALTAENRQKASVICRQSERMKNLINDLNLASKLEYNMQPVNLEQLNIIAVVRQVAADFMNLNIEEKYPILWNTPKDLHTCLVSGDKQLLKRAVSNLIQNSMNHNKEGCSIYITVEKKETACQIRVEDNGAGISAEELEKLNNAPHYMVCDKRITGQRHGLGLLIVRQILDAHHGKVTLGQSFYGGFLVILQIPFL